MSSKKSRVPLREKTKAPAANKKSPTLDRLAKQIRTEHQAAEEQMRGSLLHAKRAGELLIEAKAQVGHGKFMEWVVQHCQFSHATANGYMKIAREWDKIQQKLDELKKRAESDPAKSEHVTNLTLRGALDVLREKPQGWNTNTSGDQPTQAVAPLLNEIRRYLGHLQGAAKKPLDRLRPEADQIRANFTMVRAAMDALEALLAQSISAEPEVRAA